MASSWNQPLLAVARAADRAPELRPNVRIALLAFAQLVDSLAAQAQTLAPADVLERLIEAIKYEQVLMTEGRRAPIAGTTCANWLPRTAEWSEVAGEEDEPSTPLERFLTEAALLSGNDKLAGSEDGVTLMTLHTAKGLEWPLVVMSGLEHGLFPLARSEETPGGLEEERRLCYVGLTRSRDKLYLTWAQTRRRGGELRHSIRSKFVDAVPPEIVEEQRSSLVFSVGRQGGGMTAGRYSGWGRQRQRDDADEAFMPSDQAPAAAAEEASQDAPRYVKGERVRHRRFGSGKIQGLIGTGRDLKVSVAFDDETIGVKQLLVAYAGLERDWEGA